MIKKINEVEDNVRSKGCQDDAFVDMMYMCHVSHIFIFSSSIYTYFSFSHKSGPCVSHRYIFVKCDFQIPVTFNGM